MYAPRMKNRLAVWRIGTGAINAMRHRDTDRLP
jgi:hypothetical protein